MLSEKLKIGDAFSSEFSFSQDDVERFADLSGDRNPIHLDAKFASQTKFGRTMVHGSLAISIFSKFLGMNFPGGGTVFIEQNYRFKKPVYPGETYIATLEIFEIIQEKNRAWIKTSIIYAADMDLCVEGKVLVSNKVRL